MNHDYDYIPLSILIFQNKKIIYCNQHMKDVFIVSNKDELIERISDILSVTSEKELFDFLIKNPTFKTNKHEIEVKHIKKEYDLFLFSKLDNAVITQTSNKLLKTIKRNTIEVLSFLRGIKLYSNEEIVKIDDDKLILNISKKQLLNLFDNKEFFIKINNQCYSASCTSYIKEKKWYRSENALEK